MFSFFLVDNDSSGGFGRHFHGGFPVFVPSGLIELHLVVEVLLELYLHLVDKVLLTCRVLVVALNTGLVLLEMLVVHDSHGLDLPLVPFSRLRHGSGLHWIAVLNHPVIVLRSNIARVVKVLAELIDVLFAIEDRPVHVLAVNNGLLVIEVRPQIVLELLFGRGTLFFVRFLTDEREEGPVGLVKHPRLLRNLLAVVLEKLVRRLVVLLDHLLHQRLMLVLGALNVAQLLNELLFLLLLHDVTVARIEHLLTDLLQMVLHELFGGHARAVVDSFAEALELEMRLLVPVVVTDLVDALEGVLVLASHIIRVAHVERPVHLAVEAPAQRRLFVTEQVIGAARIRSRAHALPRWRDDGHPLRSGLAVHLVASVPGVGYVLRRSAGQGVSQQRIDRLVHRVRVLLPVDLAIAHLDAANLQVQPQAEALLDRGHRLVDNLVVDGLNGLDVSLTALGDALEVQRHHLLEATDLIHFLGIRCKRCRNENLAFLALLLGRDAEASRRQLRIDNEDQLRQVLLLELLQGFFFESGPLQELRGGGKHAQSRQLDRPRHPEADLLDVLGRAGPGEVEEALGGLLLISECILGGILRLRQRDDTLEALQIELAELQGQWRFDGFLKKRYLSELGHLE